MVVARFEVFRFLDCRALLAAFYRQQKERRPGFSYRSFARDAGIRSPGQLKLVIDGKRRLTSSMASKFARAMALDEEETDYFMCLVAIANATSQQERELAHLRMQRMEGYRRAQRLDRAQSSYHAHWYIPAIRELASSAHFRCDASWIARTLRPRISPSEAKRALVVLEELGMIERQGKRTVLTSQAPVSTGPVTKNIHVPRYHREMLERAKDAMELFARDAVDLSGVTFCVSEGGMERLKERVRAFRRELIAFAQEEEQRGKQLVHVGIQAFPLSGKLDESGGKFDESEQDSEEGI